MSHDLQRHALAAVLAQLHHRLDATQLRLGFDIGVASDRHRAVRQADIEGILGPRHDVFVGDRGGKVAVAGRGSLQRRARIGDRAPRARLVEMLMGVDQPGNDELAIEINHPRGGRMGDRRSQCGNSPVFADCQIQLLGPLGTGL